MYVTKPYLVNDGDGGGRHLSRLPSRNKTFQEEWLQELVYTNPGILPVDHLDEAFAPLISVGREIGGIDNLFVSPTGLLTIVETKLWRNPEAHRTVVAQVIEYAKDLATWDYARLDKATMAFMLKRQGRSTSLYDLVKSKARGLEIDEVEFQQRVQNCLESGRFALLIVGDRIYPGATQLAEVIHSAPHLQFSLGFVELACYKLDHESEWPLVVVPRFIERTREVTRAVVKVVYEEKKPDIQVAAMDEKRVNTGSTSYAEFVASLPSGVAEILSSCLDRWAAAGYFIYWGKVGFSLRIPWKGKMVTVFDAYPDSLSVFQDKRIREHGLPAGPHQEYKSELMSSPVISNALVMGRRYIRFEQIPEDDVAKLLQATDKLARDWFEAQRANNESLPG